MSAAAIERQPGSTVASKYRLIRVLGRGGMGVVYEAEHAMTRRRVAVKVLHPHHRQGSDAAKRFINEAQAAGRISHPNVVEVLDAGEDSDGSLYLVLELLTGHDLASALMRQRRLEVGETITVIAQVLQALEVAHRQSIIHRDIKPENIYLTRSVTGDTHVKLLDFGISKAIGGADGAALNVTQTNTTVGTPHYMSPEQARGERTIDQRADLWAVGVVLYECLAGRVPFDGETYNDQIVKVITEPHQPVSTYDVPLELSRIVDRSLEKDRTKRYGRAAEMLADLRHFVERHPEYSSVSPHLLREPQPDPSASGPGGPSAPRPDAATMDTANDPALLGQPDTLRVAPLPSLFDTANEDAPTTVRGVDELANARNQPAPSSITAPLPAMRRLPGERPRWVLAAAVLGGAIALGGVVALLSRGASGGAASASASAAMVTVRFAGLPAGGRIVVGGVPIYHSEQAVLPRGSAALPVDVAAPGFETLHFTLVPDRDQTVPVMLRPALNAPSVAPSAAPTASARVPLPTLATASPSPALAPSPAPQPRNGASTQGAAAAPRAPANPAATIGVISVAGTPPCTISVDGQIRGEAPVRVTVSAGEHRVICRTPTGALRTRDVTVGPGRESRVEFPP